MKMLLIDFAKKIPYTWLGFALLRHCDFPHDYDFLSSGRWADMAFGSFLHFVCNKDLDSVQVELAASEV